MRRDAAYLLLSASTVLLLACTHENSADPVPAIPVHTYGATSGNGSLGTHTVHAGETVWMISERYNLALRDVLDSNRLSPPYDLRVGQRLTLPAPQTYSARPGDTLYTVSRLFNTSTTELATLNKLKAPYTLNAGQSLRLPPRYQEAKPVQVAMPVPPRLAPSPSPAIEREPLAPVPAAPSETAKTGTYVPPPSSVDEYQDEKLPVSAVAKAMPKPPVREGKFIKPVNGKILSGYGPKSDGRHNDGINIQAARGDAVRSAESGVVAYTGDEIEGYGNLVLIRHRDDFVTAYAHLDKILVNKGDVIKRGQTIGTVGKTGSVDKPQLHFEVRRGTKALNPSGLLGL